MTLLYRILYVAHAKGTHHKLALRALEEVTAGPDEDTAVDWRRVFLANARDLMEGSKDPDKIFKDFQNHVLHPAKGPDERDWGGAPQAAADWYRNLVEALGRECWPDAAYAAGVLSHYYTDPWMPLPYRQFRRRDGGAPRAGVERLEVVRVALDRAAERRSRSARGRRLGGEDGARRRRRRQPCTTRS